MRKVQPIPQKNTKNPLVSVIVPVYNAEKTLRRAVRSLLPNSYQNLEVILVNDGSTDGSLKICKELAKQYREVKTFTQKNGGAGSARNLGLQKARGELFCFLDSDDQVEPEFVTTLVKLIKQKNVALAGVGAWRCRDERKRFVPIYSREIRKREEWESLSEYVLFLLCQDGRLYSVCNKIFRADVIRENHLGFDTTLDFAEDLKFVLEYLHFAKGEIAFATAPLCVFYPSGGTYAGSSIYWRNWEKSLEFTKKWVESNSVARLGTTVRERQRLDKLERRWKISHTLAVGGAKIGFFEKCKHLNGALVLPATLVARLRR